jgi:hypothetical protein
MFIAIYVSKTHARELDTVTRMTKAKIRTSNLKCWRDKLNPNALDIDPALSNICKMYTTKYFPNTIQYTYRRDHITQPSALNDSPYQLPHEYHPYKLLLTTRLLLAYGS